MGEYIIDNPDLVKVQTVPSSGQVYLGDFKGDKIRICVERVEHDCIDTDDTEADGSGVEKADVNVDVDDAEIDIDTEPDDDTE